MNFKHAQNEMNLVYFGGFTGVLVSGLVWCIAGVVGLFYSHFTSMLTLFFGGMLIHPLGLLLVKILKRTGQHSSENPLAKLALESTFILFVGLFIAFSVAKLHVQWFYPIMLLIIGVRYLVFNTLYAAKIYWLLGAVLMIAGMLCMLFEVDFIIGAFIGGIVEIIFSGLIFHLSKK
jgi:hypothetical protein